MTKTTVDPMRITKDIGRCEEAIHAAGTFLEISLYSECISRSYYAVIHASMLLLAEAGIDIRDPIEADRLFTRDFFMDTGLPEELYSVFEEVSEAKKSDPQSNFLGRYSEDEVLDIIHKARRFLNGIRKHFKFGEQVP